MKCIYEVSCIAMCPVNGEIDSYLVQITTDRVVMCEFIQSVVDSYRTERITQEELTARLAAEFCAEVTTTGRHGSVRLYCTVSA